MLKSKFIVYSPKGSLPSSAVENAINDILDRNQFVSIAVGGDATIAYITLIYKTDSIIIPDVLAEKPIKNKDFQERIKKQKRRQKKNNNNNNNKKQS